MSRIINTLIAVDELVNTLWGGSPRQTISGTVGRAAKAGKWWAIHLAQPLVNFLLRNPNHCQDVAADEEKAG